MFLANDGSMILLWIFLICVIIGIIILLVSCFNHIPQNKVGIVERAQVFYKLLKPGFSFLIPFMERKVATIRTDTQEIDGAFEKFVVSITYHIDDVKLYYYTGNDFTLSLSNSLTECSNDDINNVIEEQAKKYGVVIESIKIQIKEEM